MMEENNNHNPINVRNLEALAMAEGGGGHFFWESPRARRRPDAQLPDMEEQMDEVKSPR